MPPLIDYDPTPAPTPPVPVAPATTPPPQTLAGGQWQYPDYNALLAQWMQPYQGMYNADIKALTDRTGAQSQLAENRFSQGDTSTLARLKDDHAANVRSIVNTLAAQGLYNSGDLGFRNRREDLRYKRAGVDASNTLLDYLTGLQSQLADAQRQGLFGLQQQKLQTASTLSGMYQPTWQAFDTAAAAAPTDPTAAPSLQSLKQSLGYGTTEPWTGGL